MSAKVLLPNLQIVSRTSVFPLSVEDHHSEVVKRLQDEYTRVLQAHIIDDRKDELKATGVPNDKYIDFETPEYPLYEPIDENAITLEPMPEADEYDHDAYDKYISGKVMLPYGGDSFKYGTVKKRKRGHKGHLIGRSNPNPVLDTSIYEVEFDDGDVQAYAANVIAENLYEQIDEEGRSYLLIDEIIDHLKTDDAVSVDNASFIVNGCVRQKRTTKGWKLCIQWKDGSTSWERLTDVKESNPIEVADYATMNHLETEPAFAWWVPFVHRKRARIVKAHYTRYMRREEKFGLELPPKPLSAQNKLTARRGRSFGPRRSIRRSKLLCRRLSFRNQVPRNPLDIQQLLVT